MESKRIIYALYCPITDDIHYIGKSTQGLIRPKQHLIESHSKKIKEWVEELSFFDLKPKIKVLEYVSELEDLDAKERWWITKSINNGAYLLNDNLITALSVIPDFNERFKKELSLEDVYLQIPEFIKKKRKDLNLTQEEFASKIGMALTVIRKMEQGHTNFSLSSLLEVLKMFGYSIKITK